MSEAMNNLVNEIVNMDEQVVADEGSIKLVDCTMCRKYLPCQKASKKTDDIICGDFDNMFPEDEDVEVVAETSVEDVVEEVLMICSGACEKCAGCPNATPHNANDLQDVEGICDDVGHMVKGVKLGTCCASCIR